MFFWLGGFALFFFFNKKAIIELLANMCYAIVDNMLIMLF